MICWMDGLLSLAFVHREDLLSYVNSLLSLSSPRCHLLAATFTQSCAVLPLDLPRTTYSFFQAGLEDGRNLSLLTSLA